MHRLQTHRTRLAFVFFSAALPRLLGALLLPNAFGDAYVYIQEIGTLSTKISTRSFRLTDLFGFWLPCYQFLSALINIVIKNGFYSGKIVSALFGTGACCFVYMATRRLTKNSTSALLMFLLIALNPLHIFYSASAMTDVPHAFFVLGALYFVLGANWIVAALFAALAGLTRVESWMLIALIPLIQFIKERRISIVPLSILIAPPIFWFYISWKATGNWLACFVQRQEYHDWLLRMNPAIAHFSVGQVVKDLATLIVSSDVAVLVGCFIAGWFVIRRAGRVIKEGRNSHDPIAILSPVLFYFAFFALLLVAYLTHQQPIIFPRYGLILFSLGLPILAWAFIWIRKERPQIARRMLVAVVAVCFLDSAIQFAGAAGVVSQYHTQRAVADYLRDHFDRKSHARIFCDDGTVRVLSGIPEDKFVTSASAPRDRELFLDSLKQNDIDYLIVTETERSAPFELFPLSERDEPIGNFQSIMRARTEFIKTDIHVYRRIVSQHEP